MFEIFIRARFTVIEIMYAHCEIHYTVQIHIFRLHQIRGSIYNKKMKNVQNLSLLAMLVLVSSQLGFYNN